MNLYKAIILSLIFLCSCSGGDNSTPDFRDNHMKFHENHTKFIETQKMVITEQLNRLVNNLENHKEQEILIGNRDKLIDFADEMIYKNDVYIENCISADATVQSIITMNTASSNVYSEVAANDVDFKHYVLHQNYDQATAIILEIQNVFNKEMSLLYTEANNYSKQLYPTKNKSRLEMRFIQNVR